MTIPKLPREMTRKNKPAPKLPREATKKNRPAPKLPPEEMHVRGPITPLPRSVSSKIAAENKAIQIAKRMNLSRD